ncbi:MAG: hypothetical protein V7782_00240 [Psychromonas sp.]
MTQIKEKTVTQHEIEHTLPSTLTLIKSSVFAGIFAAIVLTVAILPAEYDIDPTGIGAMLGLTQLAKPELAVTAKVTTNNTNTEFQQHSRKIIIPAGKGLEYKFNANKGDAIRYSWKSTSGDLFFDFHGEPEDDITGYFESYAVSTGSKLKGTFTAPFDGSHGWYWKNKSSSPITVVVKTEGHYELVGIK